ncbi:hypothetical protein C0583_03860 [Candidatus Parcubacteria bacterium]|nr:MAG: hypothetical protein C0583_03860 [Candidatus Parcubacteria bacterium]
MSYIDFYNKKTYNKVGGFRKKAILGFISKNRTVVLDIGCSDGELGEIIKVEKECRVWGVDISHESIEQASKKIDKTFVVDIDMELAKWPGEIVAQKFDYIILSEVLEHMLHPEEVLRKAKELLNSDGKIIITVPNILFWKNRLRIFFGNFDYEDKGLMDRGHIHFFSWKSFCKTIEGSGLKIINTNNHIPTRGTKKLGKQFPGLFSYQFVVEVN